MALALLLALQTATGPSAPAPLPPPPSMVLVVVMDDVGARNAPASEMPELDLLRRSGVEFTRAYAHAWCAPTRDSLLFGALLGRHPGDLCSGYVEGKSHTARDRSLMRTLEDEGWGTWLVGKWHLGNAPRSGIGWEEAALYWFQHWLMGTDYSSTAAIAARCQDPVLWQNPVAVSPTVVVNDGFVSTDTRYDLARERDALLDAIARALLTPEPDLVVFAPQAAHAPWNSPPRRLLPPGYQAPLVPTEVDLYREERMALDLVIGEAVRAAGPDTWVVVLGDNGTPEEVDTDTLRGSKLDVYEGGVRVPLILHGPGLAPSRVTHPVHVMDVAPTLLRALGLASGWHQGVDLFLDRGWTFVWRGASLPDKAIVERRFKLIRFHDGTEELYDLLVDPKESQPLPLAGPDYDRLRRRMDRLAS